MQPLSTFASNTYFFYHFVLFFSYFSHVHFITADLVTSTEGNGTVETLIEGIPDQINVLMEAGETELCITAKLRGIDTLLREVTM